MLNEEFREDLHPISERFLGVFELTFYVNVRSNIVDIKPYAAYSVTDDTWTVTPSMDTVEANPAWLNAVENDRLMAIDILSKYVSAKNKYEQASNDAIKANARSEMRMAMSQGIAFYDSVHSERSNAFSPSGEGYSDFANYRWQAGKQSGVIQSLRSLKKEMDAQDEALNKSKYGVDLPDANTLIRRAATRRQYQKDLIVAIVMFLDGVLRSENKTPIYEGVSLYKALNVNGLVTLACEDQEEAKRWCKEHKLTEIDGFISNKTVGEYEDKDFRKIQHQQASGPLHLIVTADMDLAVKCLENGIKTLLWLHPVYLSAKFRPDGREGRKSWDAVVSELDRQVQLMLEDDRL